MVKLPAVESYFRTIQRQQEERLQRELDILFHTDGKQWRETRMATKRKTQETTQVAMVEPKRPRTVCVECAHIRDGYECAATVLAWDVVSGIPLLAECDDVNDGECPKWEAKPPVDTSREDCELRELDRLLEAAKREQAAVGALSGGSDPYTPVEQPVLSTLPAGPVWLTWVVMPLLWTIIVAGVGIVGWAIWQSGWRL